MPSRLRSTIALLFMLVLFGACAGTDGAGPNRADDQAADNAAIASVPPHPTVDVCAGSPGKIRCHAKLRTDTVAKAATEGPSEGYGPSDLASAYNIPSSAASGGLTVAIVDAYDDPTAESDLAMYRLQYGLSACTTANGCFKKVNQAGKSSPLPASDPGWSGEISLDLDMVSAACPDCKILLVEANEADTVDLGTAVNTAASLGAAAISNSYGGGESSGVPSWSTTYFDHPGVLITASTGDDAYGAQFPASSQFVLAVGGTTLTRSGSSRGWAEGAWDMGGAGCSSFSTKPAWQTDTGCTMRTAADVSAVADPNTGVAVVYSGGWSVYGGTSASSPFVAALLTRLKLASASASAGKTSASPPYPYAHPGAFYDVTTGSDGSCGGAYLCTAMAGHDGPTGLGTPNGALLLAPPSAVTLKLSGAANTASLFVGSSVTDVFTVTTTGSLPSGVALSVTGLPDGVTATFSPAALSGASKTTLTMTAASGATPGTYPLTVSAAGGGLTSTASLSLTVNAAPTLSASTTALAITAGATPGATTTLTTSGFLGAVAFSVGSLPAGLTAAFSPSSIASPGSGSSVLTLKASATATAGTYSVTANARTTSVTQSVVLSVTVAPAPTFTLALSPATLSLMAGTGGTTVATTTGNSTFDSAVTFAMSNLPSGVTFSADSVAAPGTGSATITLTIGAKVAAGKYSLTVTATGSGVSKTATLVLTVTPSPNFTLALAQTSATIAAGGSATITAKTTANVAFNGAIAIGITGLPDSVTATTGNVNAPGTGSSTLTLTAGSGASTGKYSVVVSATGGGVTQTTPLTLTVNPVPTFALTLGTSSVTVNAGSSGTFTAKTVANVSYSGVITLTVSGLPSGVTVANSSIGAGGTGSATLTAKAGTAASPGTYSLTVTASGGGIVQTAPLTLTVNPAPTFSLSLDSTSISATQGSTTTLSPTVTGNSSFASAVAITVSGLPTGVTAAGTTIATPGSGSATLTLKAAATAAVGTHTITVTATGGGVTQKATFSLTVNHS